MIFDLDAALIDSRKAWQYAVEEAIAATPVNEPYDPAARLDQCTAFLGRSSTDCAFVSADTEERRCAAAAGFRVLFPAWVAEPPPGVHTIGSPNQIWAALLNRETPQAT